MKEEIWDLIILKLRGELTQEGEVQFKEWLEQGENRLLYDDFELVWENVQKKASAYEPDMEACWQKLSERIQVLEDKDRKKSEIIFLKQNMFSRIAQLAAAITVLLVSTFSVAYYIVKSNSSGMMDYIAYSTLNSKSQVVLPDSTVVWLHNNSSLIYGFNKKKKQREVSMKGEVFFDVKHDKNKPFIVTANEVLVKVHGTQFNVNSFPDAENVAVSLYEGSVSMSSHGKEFLLKPGEEGVFDVRSKEITIQEADVEFAKVWTSERIRFEKKNLREVCKYLSRWYAMEFDIDPAIKDDQSFTFTFRGQSLEEVVEIMTAIHSFKYQVDEENKVILIRK